MLRHAGSVSISICLSVSLSGCVLAPRAAKEERARVAAAGEPYDRPLHERVLPDLPPEPGWRDLLQRAFLANGDLEAAYLDWKAAVIRIDRAAGYPNTNVSLGYEYMFSGDNLKAWDRTTLSIGFDPMQNLSLPPKVYAAGRVALDEARAAGQRFAAAKFDLQRRVLSTYFDYALTAEQLRLQAATVRLLEVAAAAARSRVRAGGEQQYLLQADADHRLARNQLRRLEAEQAEMVAMLNAVVGREADATLLPPPILPTPRAVPDDAQLLAVAVENNPELAALAHAVRGRADALRLARLQYLPDINPFAGLTGSMERFAGAAITLATTIPQIRAGIAEARAMLQSSEAVARQTGLERGAGFVATLAALRDAERQAAHLGGQVLPLLLLRVANLRQTYATGSTDLDELIESERAVLELQALVAEQRMRREKKLADLEALAGVDVEAIGVAATLDRASAAESGVVP
jgi:cobalt-zinc-cadmium efflux system outer membrane protein